MKSNNDALKYRTGSRKPFSGKWYLNKQQIRAHNELGTDYKGGVPNNLQNVNQDLGDGNPYVKHPNSYYDGEMIAKTDEPMMKRPQPRANMFMAADNAPRCTSYKLFNSRIQFRNELRTRNCFVNIV